MKFYQTIAPVMLSVLYTTIIFGPGKKEPAFPYVPSKICNLIGKFRGEGDFYKETGHIKPYSLWLDWLKNYTTASKQNPETREEEQKNLSKMKKQMLNFGAIPSIISIFFLFGLKILSQVLPNKRILQRLIVLNKLILGVTLIIGYGCAVIYAVVARDAGLKEGSHLSIKSPISSIAINGSSAFILGSGKPSVEMISLSDMKSKKTLPCGDAIVYNLSSENKIHKTDSLIYLLKNKKVSIYLANDLLKNGKFRDKTTIEKKLLDLPTQKDITAFDVSKNGEIIITGGEDRVRKWELQKNKNLFIIIESMRAKIANSCSD